MLAVVITYDAAKKAEKLKMLEKLLQYDVPDQLRFGKPKLPVISRS
jgi:hypothetical protein